MHNQSSRTVSLLISNPRLLGLVTKGVITPDTALVMSNAIPLIGVTLPKNNLHVRDYKRGIITAKELLALI